MLHIASRPQVALFTPARTSTVSVLPLTIIMCVNVVLVNLSLSYSSIVCYQIVRILLTPLTAAINFCFYGSRIPFLASFALIPACIGVGIVSYYDSLPPSKHATVKAISVLGVSFALSGVTSSSIYTVWVSQYHKKLKMSSMQLLYNQVPLGAMILAFVSLFTDTFPVWSNVLPRQWMMLVLSGLCACLVNLSQFLIINDAGPVSSTVVGHLKTCLIVGLGWATSKKAVGNESILGILLAILGVILYSVAMYKEQSKASR
jgi:solute carrier family 35, member E3